MRDLRSTDEKSRAIVLIARPPLAVLKGYRHFLTNAPDRQTIEDYKQVTKYNHANHTTNLMETQLRFSL
jgi:hypothetical protein